MCHLADWHPDERPPLLIDTDLSAPVGRPPAPTSQNATNRSAPWRRPRRAAETDSHDDQRITRARKVTTGSTDKSVPTTDRPVRLPVEEQPGYVGPAGPVVSHPPRVAPARRRRIVGSRRGV